MAFYRTAREALHDYGTGEAQLNEASELARRLNLNFGADGARDVIVHHDVQVDPNARPVATIAGDGGLTLRGYRPGAIISDDNEPPRGIPTAEELLTSLRALQSMEFLYGTTARPQYQDLLNKFLARGEVSNNMIKKASWAEIKIAAENENFLKALKGLAAKRNKEGRYVDDKILQVLFGDQWRRKAKAFKALKKSKLKTFNDL
jgi:hypothetical protein